MATKKKEDTVKEAKSYTRVQIVIVTPGQIKKTLTISATPANHNIADWTGDLSERITKFIATCSKMEIKDPFKVTIHCAYKLGRSTKSKDYDLVIPVDMLMSGLQQQVQDIVEPFFNV